MLIQPDLAVLASNLQRWAPRLTREIALCVPMRNNVFEPPVFLAVGGSSEVRIRPAEVFRPAARTGADAVVLVHTHRGDASPSHDDLAVTRRLVAAGAILDIPLVAHLIVGPNSWTDCFALAASRSGS
jgi:DNA repair protein RadC